MRRLLFSAAVIVGVGWAGLTPATATSLGLTGLNSSNTNATKVQKIGYWRRMYAYPPAVYGYQPSPPAYAYSPPVVYGHEAPPPAASPSAEEDYGNYPPAEGDYSATEGEYAEYPANGQ
jgi:hypothetical protein